MPWPGLRNLSRPALMALALVVWLWSPMSATPARAAGCHVPERPVLATPFSQERDGLAAWELGKPQPLAPPVLRRLPCPGEVPQVPVVTNTTIDPASLGAEDDPPPQRRESLPHADDRARIKPHPSRLDRPPRGR